MGSPISTYFLLLHQLRIGAIIDHATSENWSGENIIDLFRIDVLQFAIKNEIVTLLTEVNCSLSTKKYERKHIPILGISARVLEWIGIVVSRSGTHTLA